MSIMRYSKVSNSTVTKRIRISSRETDKYIAYRRTDRFDNLSAIYYGTSEYWWIILLANPEYAIEFDITEGTIIRIPYPIEEVLNEVRRQL